THKVGDVIYGYRLDRVERIKELNIKPYYLTHLTTGSEHLHVEREDSNNVFAVSLRTTPKNSTGVAHILEHLALCGSKKYAVRDPFFKMLTRSLATFMNAMTGPDYTVYPFSTQNRQDFVNLLKVYVDAVFNPRLRPVDFRQEGWRLEYTNPEKDDTPIILKGVVYNEMKGVFSSSSAIYSRNLLNHLYPDNTYQYESGGDPEHIPSLTHNELKKFYELHYHPSNAKFFTYGDMPLEEHLKLLNELIMSKFHSNSYAREQSIVVDQQSWTKSKEVKIACPPDPLCAYPDKQTTTSISYMLGQITNIEEMFLLDTLSSLLMDGPNAPFHQTLLESGLGSDFSPSSGLASYTKQPYFSVGLQGIHKDDVSKVHSIIEQTFAKAAKDGFADERVEAILHSVELGTKHISGNFGLRIAMSINSLWNHDGDVIKAMRVNEQVEEFKQKLRENKQYIIDAMGKYFLKNPHKLILTMEPDAEYVEQRNLKEKKLLEAKVAKLKDIDKKTILYEGMELMKIQNSKEDTSILPCLNASTDISRELQYRTDMNFVKHMNVNVQLCEQPTNEVVYFRTVANLGSENESKLSDDLLEYIPLFCDVITKLGAGPYDRKKFAHLVQSSTGGLASMFLINPSLVAIDEYREEILMSSYCLKRNLPRMFELWSHIFNGVHFDQNKDYINQLVKVAAAELADGVPHSGQLYAMRRAAQKLNSISALQERLSGLSYVAKMKDIASEEPVESVIDKLKRLSSIVFNAQNLRCSLNAEPQVIGEASNHVGSFLKTIPNQDGARFVTPKATDDDAGIKDTIEQMHMPFATNFVAQAYISAPQLHKDFARLSIMSKLVSSKFLLREVREKGGAYGSGAALSPTGSLHFYSYRDPNGSKTLDAFQRAIDWLVEASDYTDDDIEESKLGVFQDVDKPVEPGKKGLSHFLTGETDDMRQKFRLELLDVDRGDISKVAKKYLKQSKPGTFILGSAESEFPLENLPYGIFSTPKYPTPRPGVAIGDYVLDLNEVADYFTGPLMKDVSKHVWAQETLNEFMSLSRQHWQEARQFITKMLSDEEPFLRDDKSLQAKALVKLDS
ncbi:Presequence protease, mitochondrial, partial [Fragariocoptes setiger]